MEQTEVKKVPLVKKSSSFKIIIPTKVERLIRFLCEKVWDTEWSGVLFYTPTGNFEDGSLEIHCVDILPMDIGNATYTEFNMSPDVISYMAQNPELLDCKMGLIHSHNNMSTFFSGTDTATLQEEGNERNHFVSLIVNNAGKYTAAITRKIKYTSVRDCSYDSFGGSVNLEEKEVVSGEEIEYFYLDIVFEGESNTDFAEVADRLSEIKKTKEAEKAKTAVPSYSSYGGYGSYGGYNSYGGYSGDKIPTTTNMYNKDTKQLSLFDEIDDNPWRAKSKEVKSKPAVTINKAENPITKELITKIVNQLITGSVTITKLDADTRKKVINTMETRFDARFGKEPTDMVTFEIWATDFIEFLLWYSFSVDDVDELELALQLGQEVADELSKLPRNKYITTYIDLLTSYGDKY